MGRLRIYTDRSFLPEGKVHTIMVYPFWGMPAQDHSDPDNGRFNEYLKAGGDFFDIVNDPADADVFLLPFEYSFDEPACIDEAQRMAQLAGIMNKKLIVFYNNDSDTKIPLENAIVFRTSFYKSTRRKNEYAVPGWSVDFKKYEFSGIGPVSKTLSPAISYCGYMANSDEKFSLKKTIKKLLGREEKRETPLGPALRGIAVRKLQKDKRIHTNFLIREGFWAPGIDQNQARLEYAENIFSSDYALVVRGAGNFSYRLYEVLSCGRIPLFIDTDCVLPFDHIIDWEKYVVWVNQKDINSCNDILVGFHGELSDDALLRMKLEARKLYDEWISPVAFFRNLYKCL